MPPGSLIHKCVFVGERKHTGGSNDAAGANATLALREIISKGVLDKWVPIRTEDGQFLTDHRHQDGPIAYLETTTIPEVNDEDATRLLALATDETSRQTQAILDLQARRKAWLGCSPEAEAAVRRKHHTAQRLLKSLNVRIPYATRLTFPSHCLVSRRAFPQLLACIEAVALLRQFQKEPFPDGHIDADAADYRIAYGLMEPILGRTFALVSERANSLLQEISQHASSLEEFDRGDCRCWSGISRTEVANRLDLLIEAGLVEQVEGRRGARCRYRLVQRDRAQAAGMQGLLTPRELRELLREDVSPPDVES
jgi:hypothetical protein